MIERFQHFIQMQRKAFLNYPYSVSSIDQSGTIRGLPLKQESEEQDVQEQNN